MEADATLEAGTVDADAVLIIGREDETVEMMFKTPDRFLYCAKAPYANIDLASPLSGESNSRIPWMRGNMSFLLESGETGRLSRTEKRVSAATKPLHSVSNEIF